MKRNRGLYRWLALLIVLATTAFLLTRCESQDNGQIKIIYISKVVDENNAFWFSLIEGVQIAAKEYGVDLSVRAPELESDYERQNRMIEEAIAQKPDAILLSPADNEKTLPAAKKIKEAGIKLILIDSQMSEPVEDAVIATDNVKAGRKVGQLIKNLVKEDSKIAIVSHVEGTSTAIAREAGLREALGEDEKKIVDVVFSDSEYDKAYEVTKELLQKHPDVDIIAGLNEYSAIGAARAVRDLNLTDSIKMIGFDSSTEEIQLLESGVFDGLVVQKAFNMGYIGLETAVKLLRGEEVAANIDSNSNIVRKDDIYTEENQKLLFPFR
ncbi:substrate-binding domain-containing protein [Konateibacter massiliensis]|uniref:substrate-binding domain-containing protein n=1 Tax=Konateibacter massiliensis TaxID=2002841 RepID=UPI000C15D208|nr:substrate-binding domain-containing protein [Konateibacter massiliensis]